MKMKYQNILNTLTSAVKERKQRRKINQKKRLRRKTNQIVIIYQEKKIPLLKDIQERLKMQRLTSRKIITQTAAAIPVD